MSGVEELRRRADKAARANGVAMREGLADDPVHTDAAIRAIPFAWRDPRTIPPRPWLYGRHYMRGMVGATAGIGGAGKSTIMIVEAVSQAIGRDLLAGGVALPVGPMRVWLHNGEDPMEEITRRVMAVLQHYQVTDAELGGRLFVTSGRDMPILVAKALSDGGKVFEPTGDGEALVAELKSRHIDIFIADPFVTLHRVSENDNMMVDAVMTILRNVAHQAQCALEVAHHLRKLNGEEATVDAIRGAGSIVGACRSVRLVAGMTREEAERYGIPEEDRRAYLWLQNGKANMLPPTHARHWLRMEGVDLGNAAPPL